MPRRLRWLKRAAATSAGHSQCRLTIRFEILISQSVGVPESAGIPGNCQNETSSAPFESSDSLRKITSLCRLRVRRQIEFPIPFESNRRSRISSLSITARSSKGAGFNAGRDLPLPGNPKTTTNFLSTAGRSFRSWIQFSRKVRAAFTGTLPDSSEAVTDTCRRRKPLLVRCQVVPAIPLDTSPPLA
jgi:hypothetical protein